MRDKLFTAHRKQAPTIRLVAALCVLSLLTMSGPGCSQRSGDDPADEGTADVFTPAGPHWSTIDGDLQAEFVAAHQAASTNDRPVFEKYLPLIGPVALLDYLELTYPACHGQAHSLGKELYAQSQDLMVALQICGTRCTGACMHGVVGEALGAGGGMHQDIRAQMKGFCESDAMAAHKRGNCAHAIGHALLLNSHDLGYALESCNGFDRPAMRYYCATGIYMQYRDWLREGEIPNERPTPLYPCDTQKLFPAACYRYMMSFIQQANNLQGQEIIAICLQLPQDERLGCFHGLGANYMLPIMDRLDQEADVLAEVCVHGTIPDQSMCVEGAVEKMVEFDPAIAEKACEGLEGEIRSVCFDAARGGMYRLEKPTLTYYLGTGDQ